MHILHTLIFFLSKLNLFSLRNFFKVTKTFYFLANGMYKYYVLINYDFNSNTMFSKQSWRHRKFS